LAPDFNISLNFIFLLFTQSNIGSTMSREK
jgi:hypothetical protein